MLIMKCSYKITEISSSSVNPCFVNLFILWYLEDTNYYFLYNLLPEMVTFSKIHIQPRCKEILKKENQWNNPIYPVASRSLKFNSFYIHLRDKIISVHFFVRTI